MEITKDCQLRCSHCFHYKKNKYLTEKDLSIRELDNFFKKHYLNGKRFATLIGGEPSLHLDRIKLAANYFYLVIFTNGLIKLPPLKKIRRIFLSIDGHDIHHNNIRRYPNLYRKVFENYKNNKKAVVNYVITNKNPDQLKQVIIDTIEYNLKGIIFNLYIPEIGEESDLIIKKEDYLPLKNKLLELKKDSKYKKTILLTSSMIESLFENNYSPAECHFANGSAPVYDSKGNRKRCFATKGDCTQCGCLSLAIDKSLKINFLGNIYKKFEIFFL